MRNAPDDRRADTAGRVRPRTRSPEDVTDTRYSGRVTGAVHRPANSPRGDLSTMLRALIYLLPLALTIYAFIDCLNTPEGEAKHLPKVAWVFIILLFWIVGPIVWLAAGKLREVPAGGRTPSEWHRGHRRQWVAPDDNPDFLKSLKDENEKDEAVLKDWEADLRRREDELKRRESGPETPPPAP